MKHLVALVPVAGYDHVDGLLAVDEADDGLRTAAMIDEHGQAQMDRETLDAFSHERALSG